MTLKLSTNSTIIYLTLSHFQHVRLVLPLRPVYHDFEESLTISTKQIFLAGLRSPHSPHIQIYYSRSKKIIPRHVKLLSRHVYYHKEIIYEATASIARMILVMNINFLMLLKTNHTSPTEDCNIFGLSMISGFGTCVSLRR